VDLSGEFMRTFGAPKGALGVRIIYHRWVGVVKEEGVDGGKVSEAGEQVGGGGVKVDGTIDDPFATLGGDLGNEGAEELAARGGVGGAQDDSDVFGEVFELDGAEGGGGGAEPAVEVAEGGLDGDLVQLEGAQAFEQGGGVTGGGDGVGEVGDLLAHLGELGDLLSAALMVLDAVLFVLGAVFVEDGGQVGGGEDEGDQFVDDGFFEGLLGDAAGGAVVVGVGAAAQVVAAAGLAAHGDDVAVEQGAAQGAAGQAGEEEARGGAAGVLDLLGGRRAGVFGVDGLDGVPGGLVDEGLDVGGEDLVAKAQLAEVDAVGEKGGVGVDGVEQAQLGVDLAVGAARGAHLPGGAAGLPPVGVGDPAGGLMIGAVTAAAKVDQLALEAARGRAAEGAELGQIVALAALDIDGEVFGELVGHPVDEELDRAPGCALGDLVHDGVNEVTAAAQGGFEELGIVQVAGKAVVAPEDEPGLGDALFLGEVAEHVFKTSAAHGGGAGAGVAEDAGEGMAMWGAPGADGGFLLVDGEILVVATRVAQVGDELRAGREGGVTAHPG